MLRHQERQESRLGKVLRLARTAPDTALGQFLVGGSIIAVGNWFTSVQGLPGLQVGLTAAASTYLTLNNYNSMKATLDGYLANIREGDLENWKRNLLKYGGPTACALVEALAIAGYGAGTYQEGANYVAYLAVSCAILAAAPTATRWIYEYPVGKWWLANKPQVESAVERQLRELAERLNAAEATIGEKNIELENRQDQIGELQTELSAVKDEKRALEAQLSEAKEAENRTELKVGRLQKKLEKVEGEKSGLETKLQAVEAERREIKSQVGGLQEKLKQIEGEKSGLEVKLQVVEADKGEIEAQLGELQRKLKETIGARDDLQELLKLAKSQLGAYARSQDQADRKEPKTNTEPQQRRNPLPLFGFEAHKQEEAEARRKRANSSPALLPSGLPKKE